ncbi:MAG TPA: hypothetical protein VIX90_04310 [Edaphobacter sp.]
MNGSWRVTVRRPLFAFRELHRVLGPEKLHALFFTPGAAADPNLATKD